MLNKSQESKNQNIGKIIAFGSLHLLLTLRLEKEDLKSINFNYLENLEDLSFLINDAKLWEKIELTSNNELISTLLKANSIKQDKNIISYIVLDKISYNEEQSKFQKLLDYILLGYGFEIYSYEVCKCKININLKLLYKNRIKKFIIYGDYYEGEENEENKEKGENEGENNEENKDENPKKAEKETKKKENNDKGTNQEKEEDINDIGLFEKIPEEEVKFEDFNYIYIHFKDFNLGEFSSEFKLNQIYNFLIKLKKKSKIKIIFNFCENFGENEKYLINFLKISDIHIFRNKNEILNILKKRKEKEEIKREKDKEKIKQLIKIQNLKKIKIKKIHKMDSNNSSMTNLNNSLYYSSREGLNSSNDTSIQKSFHKNQSLKNIIYPKSLNETFDKNKKLSLNKNNIYNYLKQTLYSVNFKEKHPNYNNKLGIYLDEFKKIYIVKYNKESFTPDLTEYDLNIYPKSNVHNLKEINKIKNMLMKEINKYTIILYGCILRTILDGINYYFIYYYSHISILKLLALKKNNMPMPNDKSFYLVQINKADFDKMINEENKKKKENGFNNNYFQKKYKSNDNKYYPLMDKFLTSFMQSVVNIDVLKNRNLINKNKKILYEPEYKDIAKFVNYSPNDMSNQKFFNFILEENLSKNLKSKEKDYKKEFLLKKKEMKYYLPGSNGVPEYIVYLNKNERKKILNGKLPPLKSLRKESQKEKKDLKEKKTTDKEIILKHNFVVHDEKREEKSYEAVNKPIVLEEKLENEDKNKDKEKKVNIDKYKEIIFQKTPSEINNIKSK